MALVVALWACGARSAFAQAPSDADAPITTAQPTPAQAGPLVTDRPGNGNAASTVAQWRAQVEASVNYAFSGSGTEGSHQFTFPTALRVGVLSFMELRAGSSLLGIEAAPAPGSHPVSATDTFVGTKLQALRNDGWTPDLALMADVYLPSGRSPFTNDVVVPETRAAASWSLPRGFGLLLNLGTDVPEDAAGERFARMLYVANLGYTLPVLDERLSLFVESFGLLPIANESAAVIQIDAGATLLLNGDLQLDVFTQHGLSDAATDFQVAFGVSARI